jgi:hypothetical protein
MNEPDKIKDLLRRTYRETPDVSGATEVDERILSDASTTMKQALATNSSRQRVAVWRTIMRTRTARLAAPIAAVVAVFVITFWDRSAGTAWSVEQTIAAIKELKTLHIKGKTYYGSDLVDFECWIRSPGRESDFLKIRYQSERKTVVVRSNVVYEYWPKDKLLKIEHGPRIPGFEFWYRAAQLSFWPTGQMLKTLKLFSDDWKQVTQKDPNTGKELVLVTCSFRPSNTSFFFVVDTESRLIQRAKMWKNMRQEGEPDTDMQTFIYDEEVRDEVFEFEMPSGVTIVNKKAIEESEALCDKAENLFHKEKKYGEAIGIYRQIYDKFPDLNVAEHALMMIGICHGRLGQPDKAIEAFQKATSEYPNLKGWIEATYFYLGCAYMDQGQEEKALEAFEHCLAAAEGVRDPDKFPVKHARECIDRIKIQQQR